MGAKHMKCCCPDCELTTDDFNRANENPVTGNWSEISGDWGIVSNQLVNVTPGPLITTVQPQPSGRPTNGTYSTKIFFKCVNINPGAVYEIICGYTDANNYDFIRLTARAHPSDNFDVEFVRYATGETVLMDVSTHPGGLPMEYSDPTGTNGYFEGKICYSLNDWTLDATTGASESGGPGIDVHGSETEWTYTGSGGQATLPSGLGNAGFRDGDFDDFAFHMHWESLAKCDYCSCLCKSTEDINEYAQLPEELLVSFIPNNSTTEDYGADFNTAALLVTQDDGSGNLSPRKFQWKNGSDGTGTPTGLSGRFTCEDNTTGAKLGLAVPTACGTFYYGDNTPASGYIYADIDWSQSTCDPLYLVFGPLSGGETTCEQIPGGGGTWVTGIMSCFQLGNPGEPLCLEDTPGNQALIEALEWLVVVTEPP